MTEAVSICEGLLARANAKPGAGTLISCLEFLARHCAASEAEIEVRGADGTVAYPYAWADARLAATDRRFAQTGDGRPSGGACPTARTKVIDITSPADGRTVLVVNLAGGTIPDDVLRDRDLIGSFFGLVLAGTLSAQDHDLCAQRLSDLAELGTDWLWQTDTAGRFTYVSKDLTTLGLAPDMFLGRTRQDIGSQAGADIVAPDWHAMEGRVTNHLPFQNFFHPVLLPDAGRLWLRSSGKPVFAADGEFLGYKGVSAELTELIEGERSARDIVERLTAILNALPDLVFEIKPDGRYTDFIAGPAELMSGAQENMVGKTIEDMLPPEIAALSRSALDLILRDGKCPPLRYRMMTLSGWHWFETSGARKPPSHPGADPTAIFVIRNVTEDVRKQEEISRLGKIVETMTNLVALVDQDQRIIWVNAAWEHRTGWTLHEVIGRDLASLVRCPDVDPVSAGQVNDAIAHNRFYHGETVNCDRHGKRYWIDFNIIPMHSADGSVHGYVSVETDITQQKENTSQIRVLAEQQQKMRSHLQNAIEALPDGVIIWDKDERLVAVNSAYSAMYSEVSEMLVEGASQEVILRAIMERQAIPEAVGREEEFFVEELARYKKPSIDVVVRPNGQSIKRLDLRTSDGGRVAVRIDVTATKRQYAALDTLNHELDAARKSLDRIIDSADVGTWEWDAETDALRIGGSYAEMLGYTPEELGSPSDEMFRSLVHPDDMSLLDSTELADFHETPDGSEPVREHEFRMRHKDGSWKWVLSRSAVTERLPNGHHKMVVGIHLNVTSRKRLEDELRNSQMFMVQIMDGSISAIAVLDEHGTITYANAEAERVLGMGRSAIKGRQYDAPVWGITTLDGQPMDPADLPFRQALSRGVPVRDIRQAIEWPNGRRQVLSVNAAPFRDADGKAMVITSFTNITEDLQKTEQLEQALTDARAASRSKSSFLANMSHEIRTPLNGVLGMAEILDGMITDPMQQEMIRTIRTSGEILLTVLNEILDMSKIEAGKMEIEETPFVPTEIVSQIEPLHRLRAEEKGIEFEVLTNKGADLVWVGDQFRIQQILNNLLSNAIKFTDKGSVSLSVSIRDGKPLMIEVRDTGIGMTPAQVDRVFLSFEQAEGGTTRRFGGTGLGMAIVRKLVDLMGGDITIESAPGVGTTIRVTLPLTPGADIVLPHTASDVETEIPSLAGVRILVADDSAINLQVLQVMLSATQAHLTMVTNGAEAVEEWRRMRAAGEPADMLILDISMPVLDGVGALVAIRSNEGAGPQVPAIAVTANAMAHQVTEYIMAGFDAHLPKPYRQNALLHAITTLLPHRANAAK